MGKYRKKPVVIDAIQLRWNTWNEVCEFIGVGKPEDGKPHGTYLTPDNQLAKDGGDGRIGLVIPTLEGNMLAIEGDWIIKGINGEFYPCKDDIFMKTYEAVIDIIE